LKDLQGNIIEKVKSYFLVWSWASILAAYLTTSVMYSNQLLMIARRGLDLEVGASGILISTFFSAIAIAVIALGWMLFLRYSVLIYSHAISDETLDQQRFVHSFSACLRYLVLSWLSVLFGGLAPIIYLAF
tara:strand:+ start:933 stop:1325 length:393 start_codon:yes stop_codon:yes gene_type:complete